MEPRGGARLQLTPLRTPPSPPLPPPATPSVPPEPRLHSLSVSPQRFSGGERKEKPYVETAPATPPVSTAPHTFGSISHTAPIATPPASTAFWTCSMSKRCGVSVAAAGREAGSDLQCALRYR
jgi:hypothetical protein